MHKNRHGRMVLDEDDDFDGTVIKIDKGDWDSDFKGLRINEGSGESKMAGVDIGSLADAARGTIDDTKGMKGLAGKKKIYTVDDLKEEKSYLESEREKVDELAKKLAKKLSTSQIQKLLDSL